MKSILIRVRADHSFGKWNAPCNPDNNDYVYVPIPQESENQNGLEKYYSDLVVPALSEFSLRNQCEVNLPDHLLDQRMHLDPDFNHLSYGDTNNRGKRLLDFGENDVVIFYSGMRSIHNAPYLVYALIGMYVVDSVVRVSEVDVDRHDENAHTRYSELNPSDIIVRGKQNLSGRFEKYIPVGEFRNNSYRVKNDILEAWGDLTVNDGWIQRSAVPPLFKKPEKFLDWLEQQSPRLVASNI